MGLEKKMEMLRILSFQTVSGGVNIFTNRKYASCVWLGTQKGMTAIAHDQENPTAGEHAAPRCAMPAGLHHAERPASQAALSEGPPSAWP